MAFDTGVFSRYQNTVESPTNALMRGLEIQRAQQGNALQNAQFQALMQRQQDEQRQRAMQQEFMQNLPSPQMVSAQNTLAGGGGPTVANAQRMQPVDPRLQMMHGAMRAGFVSPVDYINTAMPAPAKPDYKVVGDALVAIGPNGVKEAYKGEKASDPNKPFMMVGGQVVPNPAYQQYAKDVARAGASSVSVNTGQKGLDNTLKLRGDFRSEPVYKAHQEMQSAYSQIQQSLKQKTPAGDLAGATKIMKLLDPGSVVRESELGMAMAATGLLDRVTSYATNIINGTKLTPKQREDFQSLADALYGESVKQYNNKRGEYEGIATRNGLPVLDVLGTESAAPKPVIKPGAVLKFDANGNMVPQ